MRLLLLSNSTNPGEQYLGYPQEEIKNFLGSFSSEALFIPYAAVSLSYDEYEKRVSERFNDFGYRIKSIHHSENPASAVKNADSIIIGGGNTWQLVRMLHQNQLIEPIRERVNKGIPYIGWSAGSNVACPTLKTTNDMPIVEPVSFETLNFIPFQINPHYHNFKPEGVGGETRDDRILEFITINTDIYVAGLRESTMFLVEDGKINLLGSKSVRIFKNGKEPEEYDPGSDLSFLLNNK